MSFTPGDGEREDVGVMPPRPVRRAPFTGHLVRGRTTPADEPTQAPTPGGLVLAACSSTPMTIGEIAVATGLGPDAVVLALRDLLREGEVRRAPSWRWVGLAAAPAGPQSPRKHERTP